MQELRCVQIATYIYKTRCTIREAAKIFNISKSSVFQDVTTRLKKVDVILYEKVKIVLEYNKSVKHIRGGAATKKKFQKL